MKRCGCAILMCLALLGSQAVPTTRVTIDDVVGDDVNELEAIADKTDDIDARPLTQKDFENGRRLTDEQLHGNTGSDAQLEDKNLFEGDIILANRTQPVRPRTDSFVARLLKMFRLG